MKYVIVKICIFFGKYIVFILLIEKGVYNKIYFGCGVKFVKIESWFFFGIWIK